MPDGEVNAGPGIHYLWDAGILFQPQAFQGSNTLGPFLWSDGSTLLGAFIAS